MLISGLVQLLADCTIDPEWAAGLDSIFGGYTLSFSSSAPLDDFRLFAKTNAPAILNEIPSDSHFALLFRVFCPATQRRLFERDTIFCWRDFRGFDVS